MKTLATFVLAILSVATHADPARQYAANCAGCHTTDPAALAGSSLVRDGTAANLAGFIRAGRPARGMPSFAAKFSEPEALALAAWVKSRAAGGTASTGTMLGRVIQAEDLRADRSSGYSITGSGENRHLQFIDRGSTLCYEDIDLTGVRSVEYRYAKGPGEPPRRFALVAFEGDFVGGRRHALGEKITQLTAGWDQYRTERIGLSQQLQGRYRLCIVGMEGGGVFNLDWLMLSDTPAANDGITLSLELTTTLNAGGHHFRLEKVGEINGEFWSVDFLDHDTVIATQKTGALWLFRAGQRIGPIRGIPEVRLAGQGGLLSVRTHPDYRRNGWIYLTYTEGHEEIAALTIVRGRIRDSRWVDQQTIYRDARFFYDSGAHFGGRITFSDDHLFFGIGDRGHESFAQDLTNPFGKIHRIFDDGRVPRDNPFAARPGAVPSIWSRGHRNPQGLFFDRRTRVLWSAEHGPKGGDEVNLIKRGANYGWPLATFGINYDGTPVSAHSELPGMEPPQRHWSPSPGLSNLVLYRGKAFPDWNGHLLVATLANQQLKLLRLDGERVLGEDVLLDSVGRIRDVNVGSDGLPYVALNFPNGQIYRVVPAAAPPARP